jgi:YidC/Oxa1 family membrane protein insertase
MELITNIFNTLFFGPIVNLLIVVFKLLESAGIPGALGFSIIIVSVAVRFLIWPFTATQVKSSAKMASLKPHLDELKKKHKDDKQAFAAAQMALYKEHGVNPAGGCLPALIQLPVFIAIYQVILNAFTNLDKINSLLYSSWLHLDKAPDPNFFGLNLATKPTEFMNGAILFLLVPLVTALLTFIQSKMMIPKVPKIRKDDTPKEIKEKEGVEDAMSSVQGQMVYLMPVMIGYFTFQFPIGLAIYWNIFTIMGIIQQYRISGWGGMEGIIKRIRK